VSKPVSLTSYKTHIYEHTVFVEVTMLVVLMDDGSMWERRAGGGKWKELETP
jgi:hypothetical protein